MMEVCLIEPVATDYDFFGIQLLQEIGFEMLEIEEMRPLPLTWMI